MITNADIIDTFEERFPEAKGLLTVRMVADLGGLIETAKAANNGTVPGEIVRVTRIYIFEGNRQRVEAQLMRSLGDGTRTIGDGQLKIHVATVGNPEVVTPRDTPLHTLAAEFERDARIHTENGSPSNLTVGSVYADCAKRVREVTK